jgi:hypothetical protein
MISLPQLTNGVQQETPKMAKISQTHTPQTHRHTDRVNIDIKIAIYCVWHVYTFGESLSVFQLATGYLCQV